MEGKGDSGKEFSWIAVAIIGLVNVKDPNYGSGKGENKKRVRVRVRNQNQQNLEAGWM